MLDFFPRNDGNFVPSATPGYERQQLGQQGRRRPGTQGSDRTVVVFVGTLVVTSEFFQVI